MVPHEKCPVTWSSVVELVYSAGGTVYEICVFMSGNHKATFDVGYFNAYKAVFNKSSLHSVALNFLFVELFTFRTPVG